jgi:NADH-quinone oxidoreductase subunit M
MLRFHVELFPQQAKLIAPLIVALAVIGLLYGACLALVQRDFWRLIAYAAISHLSLIALGIYGFNMTGWDGAVYQILSHGVVDAALFLLLGILELHYGTSEIAAYGGLAARLPRTVTLFVIATLAMIGLPLLSGFVGEFMILSSTFTQVSRGWSIAGAVGVILGATYMLWLVQRLFYGQLSSLAADRKAVDLRLSEQLMLWPIAVLMLVMGVAPSLWFPSIENNTLAPSAQTQSTTPTIIMFDLGRPEVNR